MKHLKVYLLATLLLSTLWFACRDQDPLGGFTPEVDVVFAGRILDEDNQPLEGARVQAGAQIALTDANGVFRLGKERLPANDAKITVSRIGYFNFSRAYFAKNGTTLNVTIQLLRKELVGSFNGNAGGTVQVPGGVTLVFPAGAVAGSGAVNVFARYIDPVSPDLSMHMPGDLRGISAGGAEQTLATFGMLAVELNNAAGQEVQIANGQEVEISMPIAAGQLSVAPAEIPLWHYDLVKARWMEEGKAQKTGNQYVGKVRHFSFWNCDAGFPLIQLQGSVFLEDLDHPAINVTVKLTILSNGWSSYGWVSDDGWFGGSVPLNEAMLMEVRMPTACGQEVFYSQTIGPFTDDVTLPDVIISNATPQLVTISGRVVDCNNSPVANSYAKIQVGDWVQIVFADQGGEFSIPFQNCIGITDDVLLTCFDVVNLNSSQAQVVPLANNAVDLGDIPACQALDFYVQYTLDGQTFLISDPSGEYLPPLTYLTSQDSFQNNTGIIILFENNAQTGTFPLQSIFVNGLEASGAQAANITTNVTAYGNVGEPIIGNFNGNFQTSNGNNHAVNGLYRVLRSQ